MWHLGERFWVLLRPQESPISELTAAAMPRLRSVHTMSHSKIREAQPSLVLPPHPAPAASHPHQPICPYTSSWSLAKQQVCGDCRPGDCERFRQVGLNIEGTPLPVVQRPLCLASTRSGAQCRKRVVPGKRRCILHGGNSTGPRTEQGKEAVRQAQRTRWKQHRLTLQMD